MDIRSIASNRNLQLAWSRIRAQTSAHYKSFFRPVYDGFELASKDNLAALREMLLGGWTPSPVRYVYLPKPDGLQRPIGLLQLEDQIVLQSIANVLATRLRKRRVQVQNSSVFSNILDTRNGSPFFFKPWQKSYAAFQKKCSAHYNAGRVWVGHFDIAAFYDTISHDVISARLSRDYGDPLATKVRTWLKVWSGSSSVVLSHGIPQGPVASDWLAECVLLPIDEELTRAKVAYVRYVDDIRIFGRTREEVEAATLMLERMCRSNGLVPQGGKGKIQRATNVREVLGSLPSMADVARPRVGGRTWTDAEACQKFSDSLSAGRSKRIENKSLARHILFNAPPSRRLLRSVISLFPSHPEQIEAFSHYFRNFWTSRPLVRMLTDQLESRSPYGYVRGVMWSQIARLGGRDDVVRLLPRARSELREDCSDPMHEQGLLRLLLRAESFGLCRATNAFKSASQNAVQVILPGLDLSSRSGKAKAKRWLGDKSADASLALLEPIARQGRTHMNIGVRLTGISGHTQRGLRAIGAVRKTRGARLDPMGDVLKRFLGVPYSRKWKTLLGADYRQALMIGCEAAAMWETNPNSWLRLHDSFNDILLRRFIELLSRKKLPGARSLIDKKGRPLTYGTLLDPGAGLARAYRNLTHGLKAAHDRRNTLPDSHPFDMRTGSRNKWLSRQEAKRLKRRVRLATQEILRVVEANS
jgi:reverse transcriptase-like protein